MKNFTKTIGLQLGLFLFVLSAWSSLVAAGEAYYTPLISVNSDGSMVSVWHTVDDSGSYIQASNYDPVGATWSAPVTISPDGVSSDMPKLATNSLGNSVVCFLTADDVDLVYTLQVTTQLSGSTSWASPVVVSPSGLQVQNYQLDLNSTGPTGTVGIVQCCVDTSNNFTVWANSTTVGGSWSTPLQLE